MVAFYARGCDHDSAHFCLPRLLPRCGEQIHNQGDRYSAEEAVGAALSLRRLSRAFRRV
jgi:hypothetical protein